MTEHHEILRTIALQLAKDEWGENRDHFESSHRDAADRFLRIIYESGLAIVDRHDLGQVHAFLTQANDLCQRDPSKLARTIFFPAFGQPG